ncbi:MAG TPA: hypothetical protein VFF69_14995 [Phycisphaerales bacterium]|nr:hypothetical protein [Phycisphaerales bacterium]
MFKNSKTLSCTLLAATAAMAGAEPTVVFSDGPGSTQGGIYRAATTAHGSFDTFCLETGEGLSFGFVFEYTLGTDIQFQGQGQVNPLDAETAFVYTRFRDGEIRDILGKPNLPDQDLANAVQLAIWNIEEGLATNNADALKLVQAADDAIGGGQWSGLGSVRVMSNWNPGHIGDPAHAKQDTLVIVPLPSSGAIAGCGLLILGARRRR